MAVAKDKSQMKRLHDKIEDADIVLGLNSDASVDYCRL
jgi:hypothetical protein